MNLAGQNLILQIHNKCRMGALSEYFIYLNHCDIMLQGGLKHNVLISYQQIVYTRQ
jgi:hypothetical protein